MAKNIVIFADGTGQEGGKGANSNIYKLFNMIEDRTSRQISFYDRGLGTGWWHKPNTCWLQPGASIGGFGISRNIKDCYTFIFENYEAGDRIYLFGFSRGAATVLSLSTFIHYFGILPKSRPELIDRAYKIYQIDNEKAREKQAGNFIKQHHTMWTKIHFIGCFDTVAALGLPWKKFDVWINAISFWHHSFHNFRLSEAVENAYHALAIDDEREYFHPVLWDPEFFSGRQIRQVWFCGMHTDVGGGYENHELSDISLAWMRDKAVGHGLLIYPGNTVLIKGDANGKMHNSRGDAWEKKLYPQKPRFWPNSRSDKLVVHHSVLQRINNQDNKGNPPYRPWILAQDYDVEY